MIHSAKERTAAYELTWSLGVAGAKLSLEYQLHALEELYVGDRLWDFDAARKRVADPFGVYRFVDRGSLRLVFAACPPPANVLPSQLYKPLFSRVRAGETRKKTVSLALPVEEYSSLSRDVSAPSALEEVGKAFLVLSYRLRSTLPADPVPPPLETGDDAGFIVHEPQLLVSALDVDKLPVKRRTGYIPRFPLPGEPPPGPIPR
jgi:hypothetical protein